VCVAEYIAKQICGETSIILRRPSYCSAVCVAMCAAVCVAMCVAVCVAVFVAVCAAVCVVVCGAEQIL